MKKSLFWLLVLLLSPVAVLVVITPMDSQKQYIFGLLSIGILFLMGFSKNRSVSVIMVVTSLLMSTRYMYFRLTQTLHFNSGIETILGMGAVFGGSLYLGDADTELPANGLAAEARNRPATGRYEHLADGRYLYPQL